MARDGRSGGADERAVRLRCRRVDTAGPAGHGGAPRLASDATGAVLAVYGPGARGRFFDPVAGAWQPEAQIEQSTLTTGGNFDPLPALDGSGNALVVFTHCFPASGSWPATTVLAALVGPAATGCRERDSGQVPGSLIFGFIDDVQLDGVDRRRFPRWHGGPRKKSSDRDMIRIAHFTGRTQKWDMARTLVPPVGNFIVLDRIASDAMGNALGAVDRGRWWDTNGASRQCAWTVPAPPEPGAGDRPRGWRGRRAGRSAVDPLGNAIAIWQQFEGGRTDDDSRSNIAISRFDHATGTWTGAVLAETQPGNAISPRQRRRRPGTARMDSSRGRCQSRQGAAAADRARRSEPAGVNCRDAPERSIAHRSTTDR